MDGRTVTVPAPFLYNATVLDWHDADTGRFYVDRGMRDYSTWSVRLLGVAARELAEPGGKEARDWLRAFMPAGSAVVLATVKPDKYGDRSIADVYYKAPLGDVLSLGQTLIRNGWAAAWDGRGTQPKPAWPRA